MKKIITKIMVPTDGSRSAWKAVGFALDMAKAREAEIAAIYVVHASIMSTAVKEEEKFGKSCLERVKDRGRKLGVKVEAKVLTERRSIVRAIVDYAKRKRCDLIVMGTKGMGGDSRFLLGSVANGVVTHASCPVLVVR